ncbi:glutamate racemase [Bacillota bacterium LX-D]|nr:glutamate racemase [Bacillota bacterium LX-D]
MIPIGVFDSGVGGLTVVRQVFKKLPDQKIIYYGDTARVPYGGKPKEELIYLADIITNFLISKGAKVIVDACNSTSAVALEHLQNKYNIPVLGVIEPGVTSALEATKNGKIGLIATKATVQSGMHSRKIKELSPNVKIYAQSCPEFVPLIEEGKITGAEIKIAAQKYLLPLKKAGIDTLILGCTHYPFIAPLLAEILGDDVTLVDPAVETVNQLCAYMPQRSTQEVNNQYDFYVSGDAEQFGKIANELLAGYSVQNVEKLVVV